MGIRCFEWLTPPTAPRSATRTFVALTALAAVLLNGACNPARSVQSGNNPLGAKPPPSHFSLAITPAAGTKNLPVSTEVGIALMGGQITQVAITRSGTPTKIEGSIRDDGTTWIPAAPLSFNSTYDVTVTGRSADGSRTDTKTTSFSTMGDPGRTTATGLYLFNGETVGVGMPVVVEFDEAVPEASRADVQRRLFVTSNPPQPGAWYWPSGYQAWYRPPNYWLPGTTLTVRAGLRGAPVGDGRYGDADRLATVTVGNKVFMDVDNATKQMNVYIDNQLVKTMPVSLGKASTPSSSGHMVTMTHDYAATFRTSQYVVDVNYAMRLTWGGEYIHAAPWSVRDQGVRNVSHGCVNVATGNAHWLYDSTHVGDPVVVRGTEVSLSNGNGWTAWNIPWSEYVKGSALPVDPQLAAVVSTPESVSASATTPPPPPPATTTTPGLSGTASPMPSGVG